MFYNKRLLIIANVCIYLVTIVLLSSCIKENLCECKPQKAMVHLQILPEWNTGIQRPEGIRIWFYSLDTHKYVQDNFPPQGGEILMREGNYQLILHNNDSEKIIFRNTGSYEAAEAYTNKMSRPSYISPVDNEDTFGQPDKLWLDFIDSFEISPKSTLIRFQPRQLTKTFAGTVKVEGLKNVQAVRGAITGMQGSILLSTGQANKSSTIFFDVTANKDDVKFEFRCFGPFHQKESIAKHFLALEFLLPHGIIQKNIDITQQIENLLDGGVVEINKEITIPPDTTGTDGGFNANVEDWKELVYPINI